MPNPLQLSRTLIFYLILATWTVLWSSLGLLVSPLMPYRYRVKYILQPYCLFACWLAKIICNIHWRISGLENIPSDPCVIISNHQSTWETFFIPLLVGPQTQVIKHELLKIPFFGWCFRMLRPIAINRKERKNAMQQVVDQGSRYLKDGVWVLIFPEGTRNHAGKVGKFSRGGAVLASKSGVRVLPVAHNAGNFWPGNKWLKNPGVIDIIIGEPIPTKDKTTRQINQETHTWIERTLIELDDTDLVGQVPVN